MLNAVKNSGLRWLWLAALVLVLDQVTKLWVIDAMHLYQSVQIMPSFNLTYVRNYGAAFSFLSDSGGWQRWFFTAIAIGVSGLILYWLKQTKAEQVLLPSAFCLILGGALGNLYDRLAYGYVIDFLDVYYGTWHWPAFNIADSAICVGAALLIIDSFRGGKEKQA
ncbi:signal peptidase II [Aliiglaciecola sp. CAU 1673]|uniref:signal peptidase II n=1 Tax=Aliiglaciecola sp. CAU 1673 TaxID=3032595 RepID=UPI0023DA5C38|nr:signal peptidase II [Aliiglaciecola sp. CAU 1673]MDF2178229.1 signal peptidase II [Aliiglaciecola sp. CAU 1673]